MHDLDSNPNTDPFPLDQPLSLLPFFITYTCLAPNKLKLSAVSFKLALAPISESMSHSFGMNGFVLISTAAASDFIGGTALPDWPAGGG